jgi:hypothetical protein
MNRKKIQSRSELEKLDIPDVDLRAVWGEQVVQQTKPMTRKSLLEQNIGKILFSLLFK